MAGSLLAALVALLMVGCDDELAAPDVITVNLQPPSASVWPTALTVMETGVFTIEVREGNDRVLGPEVTWSTDRPELLLIQVIDERTVRLTARASGTATLTVSLNDDRFEAADFSRALQLVGAQLEPLAGWEYDGFVSEVDTVEVALSNLAVPTDELLEVRWSSTDPDIISVEPLEPAGTSLQDSIDVQMKARIEAVSRGPVTLRVEVSRRGSPERAEYSRELLVSERWRAVRTGLAHNCAISWSREVYCWGGGLGVGFTGSSTRPTRVVLPQGLEARAISIPHFANVTPDFEGRGLATCVVMINGPPYCWGNNAAGKLGTGDDESRFFPVAINIPQGAPVQSLELATDGACAVVGAVTPGNPPTASTETVCWGVVTQGRLGIGTNYSDTSGPTNLADGIEICTIEHEGGFTFEQICALRPLNVAPSTDGITLSDQLGLVFGQSWFCAHSASRAVHCWGDPTFADQPNADFCPGIGVNGFGLSHCASRPHRVGGLAAQFDTVAAGPFYSCGLSEDLVSCWGHETPTRGRSLSPIREMSDRAFTSIATAQKAVCGLEDDGKAYCFGHNVDGLLGASRPDLPVGGNHPPAEVEVDGDRRYAFLTGSAVRMCAITLRGAMYCWGLNRIVAGEPYLLGDPGTTDRVSTTPVRVAEPLGPGG